MTDSKVGMFEQKMKEAAPGYRKGEQKPVGQRDWNPSKQGAFSPSGYNAQTTSVNHGPPAKKSISDLP